MKNEDTVLIGSNVEKLPAQRDSRIERVEESKQIIDQQSFEYNGIKVRVFYEGAADLNDLVKGLFMAG